jgi:hypothetical protein
LAGARERSSVQRNDANVSQMRARRGLRTGDPGTHHVPGQATKRGRVTAVVVEADSTSAAPAAAAAAW